MASMPEVGAIAPPFEADDQDGRRVRLADFAGRWVVLYFYPRDDTPGCTTEACSFRDNHDAIMAAGAVVLGVSGDTGDSHRRFIANHGLPFSLLVDTDRSVATAYGAWGLKRQYGREFEGVIRSTFIIDPSGRVAHRWARVKTAGHGDQVLKWLQANTSS